MSALDTKVVLCREMRVKLEISAPSPLWRNLPRARAMARETVGACVSEAGLDACREAEVSLLLTSDAEIQALNARYRGQDKPTNVLSFPSTSAGRLKAATLGDVALAFETLAREAAASNLTLADHYRHLVAHGFLHLIGYDHGTDEEAERMETLETRILARLGVGDPYADEAEPNS